MAKAPKEVVATRTDPSFKKQIVREAQKIDRPPAWLIERLLKLGWEAYFKEPAQ
jgi:hypothetical protein